MNKSFFGENCIKWWVLSVEISCLLKNGDIDANFCEKWVITGKYYLPCNWYYVVISDINAEIYISILRNLRRDSNGDRKISYWTSNLYSLNRKNNTEQKSIDVRNIFN